MKSIIRLDEPGSFHHVITRAVDGKKIFAEESDQRDFIKRLSKLVSEDCLGIHAWVLMSNHAHLLVEVGRTTLSRTMQRLLSGFAMSYNRREKRKGHLFQARFRSILIDKDSYFLELIRYIHLNPLRAGIVSDFSDLARYSPSGHSHIIGIENYPWQSTDLIRETFESSVSGIDWRRKYLEFLGDNPIACNKEYEHGSLLLSKNGIVKYDNNIDDSNERFKTRILGSKSFAKQFCRSRTENRCRLSRNRSVQHDMIENLISVIATKTGVTEKKLRGNSSVRRITSARKIAGRLLVNSIGLSQADAARYLGISPGNISRYIKEDKSYLELVIDMEISKPDS